MNELLAAAKTVIDTYEYTGSVEECEAVNRLHEAVERTEDPPAYFMEWWETFPLKTDNVVPAVHAWEAGFTAAQQVERERIKMIIKYQFGNLVSDLSDVMEMIDE